MPRKTEEEDGEKQGEEEKEVETNETSEDEDEEDDLEFLQHDKDIMESNVDKETKQGSRLSMVRFVVFFHEKSKKKKGGTRNKILNERLADELKTLEKTDEGKGLQKKKANLVYRHLQEADETYHPIQLDKLEVELFIAHLVNLKDSTHTKEYRI